MSTPRHAGFTLIEMMIVVVIIGILAAILVPSFMSKMDRAREASTKANMHSLQLAAEDFAVEHSGNYSPDADQIALRLPPNFRNPFTQQIGAGFAWEDRPSMSVEASPIPGVASYADSDTMIYNIKGWGRSQALNEVLTSGR